MIHSLDKMGMFVIREACIALLLPFKIKNKGIAVLVPSLPSKSKRLKSCCLLSIKRLQEWSFTGIRYFIKVASGPSITGISCLLHPDHQSCLQTITGCLRTINYGNLVVCCIRIIKVASRPSRVASGPSELPPDHVRKKISRRRC